MLRSCPRACRAGYNSTVSRGNQRVLGSAQLSQWSWKDVKSRVDKHVGDKIPKIPKLPEMPDRIKKLFPENTKESIRYAGSRISHEIYALWDPETHKRSQKYSRRDKMDGSTDTDTDLTNKSGSTSLMNVEQPKSSWDKFKDRFRSTPVGKGVDEQLNKVKSSELYEKASGIKDRVEDKVEDWRDSYETSQNPIVWHIREVGDSVAGESDAAMAFTEIKRIYPDFTLPNFLEEMEYHMIPHFVTAYRQMDTKTVFSMVEGQAASGMRGMFIAREAQNAQLDDRILDLRGLEFQDAMIVDGQFPVISFTVVCQHVHCVRDVKDPESIQEGSETSVETVFYSFVVTPDTENLDFNWKIVDIGIQNVQALI